MANTKTAQRIGAGKALPMPGDVVSVSTAASDYTGTVTEYIATPTTARWTVSTDDGCTVYVTDRAQLTLTSERLLPMVQRGEKYVLDERNIAVRQSRGAL